MLVDVVLATTTAIRYLQHTNTTGPLAFQHAAVMLFAYTHLCIFQ
jgi:hypothetical protein